MFGGGHGSLSIIEIKKRKTSDSDEEEEAWRREDCRGGEAVRGRRPVKELAREPSVTGRTPRNWKSKYGAMEASEAQRPRMLEEDRRLKEMVADLGLATEATSGCGEANETPGIR